MLAVQPARIQAVRSASVAADLYPSLQSAIELEHATLPPYLTALYSIKQGHNLEAAQIIGSVCGEEMLHMAIACNLMNAIGGSPDIDNPLFIPAYPGPLPMGVRSGLTVGLEKLTRRLVHDVFMSIEEPEQPLDIPVTAAPAGYQLLATEPPSFATIGDFYHAIAEKLVEFGPSVITGDPAKQVSDPRWYPETELFPILTLDDALRGIDIIVEQGEGTTTSPLDLEGQLAHYYRYAELVYGRRLIQTDTEPGWAYAGAFIPIEQAGVWDIVTDAKAADYPPDSHARVLADAFNAAYTQLLRCLHRTFNGETDALSMAISVMVEMHLTAQKLVATPVPGTSQYAAPTFEYSPGASG
ncbi:MAG TPA: ferritin-like protein [Jatrophihabitans sp.]|nr:ferritin-like protein [Jatrophihabitans sp.]